MITNVLYLARDGTPAWVVGALEAGDSNATMHSTALRFSSSGCEHEEYTTSPDTGEELGLLLTLQSVVVLLLWMRLVFFLRGFLAFGALVHMVIESIRQASGGLLACAHAHAR